MNSLITKKNKTYYNSKLIENKYEELIKYYKDLRYEYLQDINIKKVQKYNELINECELNWLNIDNVISFYKNFDLYLEYEKDWNKNVNFDMNFAPNAVSAFVMSGEDFRNVILICINFLIAAVIWFPFFKAADKAEMKKEQERKALKEAKKAA